MLTFVLTIPDLQLRWSNCLLVLLLWAFVYSQGFHTGQLESYLAAYTVVVYNGYIEPIIYCIPS